jgi:Predicted transcriptional regulators
MQENDLLSIKEFSEYSNVKQSVLRYYDEIGLFSPIKRGENGYRYYSHHQLVTLKHINVLINLKTALKEISAVSKHRTPTSILELLVRQEIELDKEMRKLQQAYSITHVFRDLLQAGLAANESEIIECDMMTTSLVMGPRNDFGNDKLFYNSFIHFCHNAEENRINLNYPVGGYFDDMDTFLNSPAQPTHFFSLDPAGTDQKNAGRYIVGFARGFYGEMGDLPERLNAYAKKHSLTPKGPVYIIYLFDEISTSDPSQYLARISIAIKPQKG